MIVRIMGEGQLEVAEAHVDLLNQLDAEVETAVEDGDQARFDRALAALLDGVRDAGSPLDEDFLHDSDLILPPADATLDEVRALLGDEGLIPGRSVG